MDTLEQTTIGKGVDKIVVKCHEGKSDIYTVSIVDGYKTSVIGTDLDAEEVCKTILDTRDQLGELTIEVPVELIEVVWECL